MTPLKLVPPRQDGPLGKPTTKTGATAPVAHAGHASAGAVFLVIVLAAFHAAIYSAVCITKYHFYLYDDFDLAIFAQATAGILRGTYFGSIRGMTWLGDHTSLVLFLLAPIYAVFRHPITLLVVQSLALGAGAVPVFGIARRQLGRDGMAVGCAALYLLHPAVGYTNLFEFHPETLATPALLCVFYGVLAGRRWTTLIAATLALSCREDVALVVLPLALWAWWRNRRVDAVLLGALAAASLAISFAWLKPAYNQGEAGYGDMYRDWGSSLAQVAANVTRRPLDALRALVSTPNDAIDTALKQHYYLYMLTPLAFLPLVSPITCLIALPMLAAHFLSWRQQQHTIIYQYTALVTPVLMAAAVAGLGNLARMSRRGERHASGAAPGWLAAVLAVAIAGSLVCNAFFGPLTGARRVADAQPPQRTAPDGDDRAWKPNRDRMLAEIPQHGGVVAGFEFLSHLTGRDNVHSAHHIFTGTYTFSKRPYPVPDSIAALLVDPAHDRMLGYIDPGTGQRLRELAIENALGFTDKAGDLVLLTRGSPDTLRPLRLDDVPPTRRALVTFDGALQFLGADSIEGRTRAGSLLPLRTVWRRQGNIDRNYLVALALFDGAGQVASRHLRYLGYAFQGPETWPAEAPVTERYAMMLPGDLAAGRYTLAMAVAWARGDAGGYAEPDTPAVREAGGFITLGVVEIAPPR